ncbi:MAG: hypothetical protein Q8N08_09310, partial [Methanobacteriaceae archaeon]|nr:hypothetical protein [Methanobacteriaceae archaeon]
LGKARFLNDSTNGDSWLKGNSRTTEAIIKEFITDRLESIKKIGGYKSKGFGKVEIKVKII